MSWWDFARTEWAQSRGWWDVTARPLPRIGFGADRRRLRADEGSPGMRCFYGPNAESKAARDRARARR